MIKGILGLSLVLNFVLGYFLFSQKKETEVIEKVVVEKETVFKPVVKQVVKEATSAPKKEQGVSTPEFLGFEEVEFQDAGEKMENDRHDFFTEKLAMTDDKIAEHNKIREEYFKATSEFWKKDPMRELSFKERRQMIDMEEAFHAKLEQLHGKKNWERYLKFRESYNQQGFKKQQTENQPFIFMGL
ncbi:hypothetical protein [Peredibacter starrii]|uniref:Uncharacterized protein n=1 Tax=Peredibacter starrii TaxID=28202 RepID=A0AAX4HKH0_9BACT|nr:hypothetical protein [Peredibacter starrii]WPU63650.1 hypothetical protein SOO65_13220 [Peredibacter starrii]